MRVTNQPIPEIAKIYNRQNKDNPVNKKDITEQHDAVSLSDEARFFGVALKALQQLPESSAEREKMLEELKTAIKVGSYAVENGEVAEKILNT